MSRLRNIIQTMAATLAILVLLDILTFQVCGPGRIRGMDWVVLVAASALLLTLVFARNIATKISLAVLMVGVALLVVELILSIPAMKSDRSFAWYVWPPNYIRLLQPEKLVGVSREARFTTNSRGIRGPEFSPKDRYRILCVGGSTTECLYLDDTKTWPAILNQILSHSRNGTWVGNVGRSGHMASDHTVVLANLPEAQMVDCWLLLCGINDVGNLLRGVQTSPEDLALERVFSHRRAGIWGTPVRRPLHRNFMVYNMLELLRQQAKALFSSHDRTFWQDAKAKWVDTGRTQRRAGKKSSSLPDLGPLLDTYERRLCQVIQLSKQSGKRLIMATQPTIWHKDLDPETERYLLCGWIKENVYFDQGSLAIAMEAFNERLKKTCSREGIQCVDLAAALPKNTEVFYDDCHFNEEGARRVAALWADAILAGNWWQALDSATSNKAVPVTQTRN